MPVTAPDPMHVSPQNPEAEISVLGAILQSQEALETLNPRDFYRLPHAGIYETAASLFLAGESVDLG